MGWTSILNDTKFYTQLNVLPTKGKLVYEYNPFRNYRLSESKYLYKDEEYTLRELKDNFGINYNKEQDMWEGVLDGTPPTLMAEKGQLIDFITDELNFSLEHPVQIIPQYSYDGSVNLIINDGLNKPRLINSRFSATGMNTYEIVDRKGNNDTNIYDSGVQFDIDTSLYKIVDKIPKVELLDVSYGGNLPIGNYHFYFKLSDSDGNETDFVAESGLVSVFIGDSSFSSVNTGVKNQNSTKQVEFRLKNVDSAYDYIIVYYSRSTAEGGENMVTEYCRIDKKFNKSSNRLIITGFENVIQVPVTDINTHYNLVEAAKTQATCQNMLFLGNVKKQDIPYEELQDLSLRILPLKRSEIYKSDNIDYNYSVENSEDTYIDAKFIHDKTGYWPGELYRFGIVYMLPNGELTPVFNIRGGLDIKCIGENPDKDSQEDTKDKNQFSSFNLYTQDDKKERVYVPYNENNNLIINGNGSLKLENVKGVCSFANQYDSGKDGDEIIYVNFTIPDEVVKELRKYVKGYFFVRQTRIPLVMAQGITVGIDKEARIPTIPTKDGLLEQIADGLEKTYVETDDINGINYISEGFLKRYSFTFKRKGSNLWKKIGKIAAVSALLVGSVALTIVTAGTAAPGVVAGWASALGTVGSALVTTTAAGTAVFTTAGAVAASTVIGVAGGAVAAVATAGTAAGQVIVNAIQDDSGRALKGRQTQPGKGEKMVETDDSRLLTHEFSERIIIKDGSHNDIHGIICPDYTVNSAYYNQIFTGNKCFIRTDTKQSTKIKNNLHYFDSESRHYYISSYKNYDQIKQTNTEIIGVPDNVKAIGLNNNVYRSRAGEAEEVFRYESIAQEYIGEDKRINSDIVRGSFGPYLAFNNNVIGPAEIVNIYIPGYSDSNMTDYVNIRMSDNSTFFAITDRYSINNDNENYGIVGDLNDDKDVDIPAYRGDCYICQFTQRVFRNFNDPSAPYNDEIVDAGTWKNNYDPNKTESYANINLGDINAIQMGMWVTFQLRSSYNLNIRTVDESYVDEAAMSGHPRSYHPNAPMSVEGTYKLPESQIYNKGFSKSVSDRWNFEVPDVPHIKNWFGTRIMYSDIHVNDSYKNGYRIFQGTHYRDYTREYGEIVKLISLESNLLCVFEHGIALIPVNERAVAGQGAGGNVYINTSNVLPENPKIISDMFGSQWPESVLKVPGKTGDSPQYVYGVDTVAKKIWRTDGNTLECISDFKVQEFLNNNITLGERELTSKIGIRNVKTVYNAFKRDVMFTFYDNTYGFEEKVWNLCWNELLQQFVTFYSWVPSYMENINNIPFSFNRDTSKWLAKLGTSHKDSSFADGIVLSNVVIKEGSNVVGTLDLKNRVLPELDNASYEIKYHLEHDQYGNYKLFKIEGNTLYLAEGVTVSQLYSELYYRNKKGNAYADDDINQINIIEYDKDGKPIGLDSSKLNLPKFKNSQGKRLNLPREKALNPDKIVRLLNIRAEIKIKIKDNATNIDEDFYNIKAGYEYGTTLINAGYYESVVAVIPKRNLQFLSTDFWKHCQAGIIDIADDIKPTYWYGKRHPFEFEIIVVNDPSVHKIFDNLEIVSNKAKPESFHYEIVGDSYDFAKDKPNMYFRQEAKKALWQYNGGDVVYNRDFIKIQPKQQFKSADFPHKYYYRQDTINEIEDYYYGQAITNTKTNADYRHLAGAEIVYYPNLQEFRICNHVMAVSKDDLLDTTLKWDKSKGITVYWKDNNGQSHRNEGTNSYSGGRSLIGANCEYLENKWKVQINPIVVCYKNEYNKVNGQYSVDNTQWFKKGDKSPIPGITIYNSDVPNGIEDSIVIPEPNDDNIISQLYDLPEKFGENGNYTPLDLTKWLDDVSIYKTNFGEAQNRKEVDLKDKYVKIRIRYSGEDLAVIDFLNTIYRVSYA